MTTDAQANEVLDYWFGPKDGPEAGKMRKLWFQGGKAADDEITARFGELHARACAGELDAWQDDPQSCLALVIVLDQFSRNIHRGTADAFAADAKALSVAKTIIVNAWDNDFEPLQRWFVYLPFEHSENVGDQQRAIALLSSLPEDENRKIAVDYAQQHLDVIAKFGRFPHRNEILGRESTPEETKWLAEGGARFG